MKALRAVVFFVVIFLMFRAMSVFLHVRMSGWQFIVFVIVLAGIASFLLDRK